MLAFDVETGRVPEYEVELDIPVMVGRGVLGSYEHCQMPIRSTAFFHSK